MQEIFKLIKGAAFATGGCIGAMLGGWDMALKVLVALVIADYITGVSQALYNKTANSEIGYKGIIKKINIFIMVAVTYAIDNMLGTDHVIRTATIFFYAANEGLSILENMVAMDLPVPSFVKEAFEKIRDDNDKKKVGE